MNQLYSPSNKTNAVFLLLSDNSQPVYCSQSAPSNLLSHVSPRPHAGCSMSRVKAAVTTRMIATFK